MSLTMKQFNKQPTIRFDEETEKHLKMITDFLIDKYGQLKPEWNTILVMLADNLTLYHKCKRSVEEVGVYDVKSGRKNPLLSTLKDLQSSIMKQILHLGISPMAASKIKDTKEDNSEDFIDSLTK